MRRLAPIILIGLVSLVACARAKAPVATSRAPLAHDVLPAALERVHFPTGRAAIVVRDRGAFEENARWAREHPEAILVLEGHCDERGGDAFNLELGDRRARAVLAELARKGIDPAKLIVLSQGKRAPLDARHRPDAWARNRRVEFIVR